MAAPRVAFESLSNIERYEKGCAGKEQHPSQSAADAVVAHMKKDNSVRRRHTLHSYKCQFGDHWHVGHES